MKQQPIRLGLPLVRAVKGVSHHGVTQVQSVHPDLTERNETSTARETNAAREIMPEVGARRGARRSIQVEDSSGQERLQASPRSLPAARNGHSRMHLCLTH